LRSRQPPRPSLSQGYQDKKAEVRVRVKGENGRLPRTHTFEHQVSVTAKRMY